MKNLVYNMRKFLLLFLVFFTPPQIFGSKYYFPKDSYEKPKEKRGHAKKIGMVFLVGICYYFRHSLPFFSASAEDDDFSRVNRLLSEGSQIEIDNAFLGFLQREREGLMGILVERTSENCKFRALEWVLEENKLNLLKIFTLEAKEKFLQNCVENDKLELLKKITSVTNFPKSTKIGIVYFALKNKKEVFKGVFGKNIDIEVLRKYSDDDIAGFFDQKEMLDALRVEKKSTKDLLREGLECSICQDLFKEPVESKYGHKYCKECILEWLQYKNTCPQTRRPLFRSDVFPADRDIQNRIDKYKLKYPED